jgi:hypothetical protein
MNRRELFKRAATAVVPIAAAPIVAIAQQHAHNFPDLGQMSSPAEDPNWKPEFFTTHENATVVVATELIIPETDTPGARAALVNRYMDKLLLAEPPAQQERFRSGLKNLDEFAIRMIGKAFIDCLQVEQTKALEALEAKNDPFFHYIKGFTALVFYATKAGFLEMNKGGRVPDTFGCTDAGHNH